MNIYQLKQSMYLRRLAVLSAHRHRRLSSNTETRVHGKYHRYLRRTAIYLF